MKFIVGNLINNLPNIKTGRILTTQEVLHI